LLCELALPFATAVPSRIALDFEQSLLAPVSFRPTESVTMTDFPTTDVAIR
jgi:hypothetical protein